jgi:hypothetical protein
LPDNSFKIMYSYPRWASILVLWAELLNLVFLPSSNPQALKGLKLDPETGDGGGGGGSECRMAAGMGGGG